MDKPLIGLLCIDRKDGMSQDVCSYIDDKNVKYLEDAGAGVVPIWYVIFIIILLKELFI